MKRPSSDATRARDRALVRTFGSLGLLGSGVLLEHGVTSDSPFPFFTIGVVLLALGLLALRFPDVLWVSLRDPSVGAARRAARPALDPRGRASPRVSPE